MEEKRIPGSRKEPKRALTPEERKRKKRKRRITWLSILAVLIIFRLILPYIVLNYVNKKLANLEEYYGHVDDIDIHLYRGAYEIKDIKLLKKVEKNAKKDTIPFFKAPSVDLSIEWNAIFHGAIVGEISVEDPVLNFVKEKHKGEDIRADTADFRQLIDDLMPVTINRFDIHNGEIHYHDLEAEPKLDIAMKNINMTATNLTNVTNSKEVLPATLKATADVYEGAFSLNMKFDGLAKVPTFDLNTEMKGMNLVLLNDMLREYGNFDVKKGNFSMYGEFAAKDGKFGGYVKPFLRDLDVVQWNKAEGDVPQILWETVVGTSAEVLQNQRKEQLATKIAFNGTFDEVHLNTWRAVSFVLRNAFLRALRPSVDHSISINRLKEGGKKTFLEKIFREGDPEKKAERQEKREKRKMEREKK